MFDMIGIFNNLDSDLKPVFYKILSPLTIKENVNIILTYLYLYSLIKSLHHKLRESTSMTSIPETRSVRPELTRPSSRAGSSTENSDSPQGQLQCRVSWSSLCPALPEM